MRPELIYKEYDARQGERSGAETMLQEDGKNLILMWNFKISRFLQSGASHTQDS